jgi:microsomal dipeptidase-like Zn-dependent dipeptidase
MSDQERETYLAEYAEVQAAAADRIASEVPEVAPPVDVADFVDHIDYMVDLIGLEHVGISSDFDGGGGVEGWDDASETFNVTLELVRRGYSEDEIGLLWSGNLLRVLDQVQAVAAEIQAGG